MVKRYNMTTSCRSQVFEVEANYGDWVAYTDYEKLEERVRDLEAELGLSNGALDMVRESLVNHGVDMEACPPMLYPEAIHNAVVKMSEHVKKIVMCAVNWHKVSGEGWGAELKELDHAVANYLEEESKV